VLYIAEMSRFPKWPWALAAFAAVSLLLAGFASGCGSGEDEPSTPSGTASSPLAGGGGSGGPGGVDAQPGSPHQAPDETRDAEPGTVSPSRPGDDEGQRRAAKPEHSQPQRPSRVEEGATVRAYADSCLEQFSRATCAEMAKPAEAPSQRIEEPDDCLQVMSRDECEALVAAQQAARYGESVNLEECIENPTPRCEEVLRSVLEAQEAASPNAVR
jgi:hypothetical protein